MMFYFQAFLALGSCRQTGFGEGRIPWTATFEYADKMGLLDDEFEDLWTLVSLMDAAYLKYRQAQADKKRQAEAAGKK